MCFTGCINVTTIVNLSWWHSECVINVITAFCCFRLVHTYEEDQWKIWWPKWKLKMCRKDRRKWLMQQWQLMSKFYSTMFNPYLVFRFRYSKRWNCLMWLLAYEEKWIAGRRKANKINKREMYVERSLIPFLHLKRNFPFIFPSHLFVACHLKIILYYSKLKKIAITL